VLIRVHLLAIHRSPWLKKSFVWFVSFVVKKADTPAVRPYLLRLLAAENWGRAAARPYHRQKSICAI